MRLVCGASAFAAVFAQVSSTPSLTQSPVLRITVNLVQVDAVVTDSSGRQVTNLGADDFEVVEDGRLQKITACTYVRTTDLAPHRANLPPPARGPVPSMTPAVHVTPEQVRRTVVLLVDDLGLTFESVARVRGALRKFVDEQMREGDLVAIIRTRGGMGSLEQFTADKRILYAAIDRVRWYVAGGHAAVFEPIGYDAKPNASTQTMARGGTRQQTSTGLRQGGEQAASFSAGTLGSINFVIRALRDMPGRKAVILFSDGVPALMAGRADGGILEGLRQLADLANRSAVVLYTVDARGLQTFALAAADNTNSKEGPMSAPELADVARSRQRRFYESEQGLDYLAHQTGGFFMHDSNDLDIGIVRALEDMSGYYLIGYKPSESSFELEDGHRRFHKIEVRVKEPGLHVRSRTGYIGIPDEEARKINNTPAQQLIAALNSPFDSSGLSVRLTCLFSEEPKTGAAIRMLLHVDSRDLSYSQEPDGTRQAVINIAAVAIGEQGVVAGSKDRTYTVRLSPREFEEASIGGIVYKLNVNLAKPGAYQTRVAVRDAGSGKMGSASQFVEIPNLRRRHIALSGIIMNGPQAQESDRDWDASSKEYGIARPGTTAFRVFHPGETVSFAYVIFDPRSDTASGTPKVETQYNLYRDGQRVYTSAVTHLRAEHTGLGHLVATGTLQLSPALEPGEYVFEAVARDQLAPHKYQVAAQWTDLELTK